MQWSDKFKRCVQLMVRILDISSWLNEKKKKKRRKNLIARNNVSLQNLPHGLTPTNHGLRAPGHTATSPSDCHTRRIITVNWYIFMLFLSSSVGGTARTSCACAVSARFKIICDFPERWLMPLSGLDSNTRPAIYQDPHVWTSSWYFHRDIAS